MAGSPGRLAAAGTAPRLVQRLLSVVDPGAPLDRTFTITHDARHVAYRSRSAGGMHVVVDGRAEASHDSVGPPAFLPDGRGVAYPALDGRRWALFVAGSEVAQFDDVTFIRDLTPTPNGKSMLFVAGNADSQFVVADGRHRAWSTIESGSATYSRDGRHVAYSVRDRGRARMVLDQRPGRPYDEVGRPEFSPDGRRLAYRASERSKWQVVLADHGGPFFDNVSSPIFSADGRRIAYVASVGDQQCVVVDGVQGPRYDVVGDVVFSPDGARVAYPAQGGRRHPDGFRHFVVVDGTEGMAYETVVEGTLVFSADSRHLAYEAEAHDQFFAVSDRSEGKHYDDLLNGTLQFMPGSDRLRYVADLGGRRVVVVGARETEAHDDIRALAISRRDGRVAYQAKVGDQLVVYLDGERGPLWDQIVADAIEFDPDGCLHYVAVRADSLFTVQSCGQPLRD